jgi:spermidine/putrescine transport system ATP-binding protein
MSDRIAVMRAGRIEQLGTPEELYERPQTEFVAGFLGVSNLLGGSIVGRDGSFISVRVGDGTVLRAPADGMSGGATVRVGVRPEKLRVIPLAAGAEAAGEGELNSLDGTILDASYIGVSTQYLVETRDGHKLTVYAQNLETGGAAEALADGQPVRLTWKPQHTFVISVTTFDESRAPYPSEEGAPDV